jgi:dTDP-4-dehydrorhamnose 3,5-epimerase
VNWRAGNVEGVTVRPLTRYVDARGWLLELFREDELPRDLMPVMAYVSLTRPGVTRGPHEHRVQTDVFAMVGPGRLRVWCWDARPSSPSRGVVMAIPAGEDDPVAITVPPGVVHAYRNVSERDAWVLNFPNRLYRGPGRKEDVDEIRHEDRADAAFPMV